MPPSKLIRRLADGTAWPVPGEAMSDLGWDLRYASDERVLAIRLSAAAVVSAYQALVALPQRERDAKIKMIRATPPGLKTP